MTRLSIPVTVASFSHRGHHFSIRYRKSEAGLDDLDEYLASLVLRGPTNADMKESESDHD